MRKMSLLLVALLVFSVGAFAEEVAVDLSVSGDASVTFGYDLDSETYGFSNAASFDFELLFGEEDVNYESSGDAWYGYILFEEVTVTGSSAGLVDVTGTAPTAKLTNGTTYVDITAPSDAVNYAASPQGEDIAASGTIGSDAGITIGTAMDPISDVAVSIISDGDWTANTDNDLGVAFSVDVDPVDLLSIEAGVIYSAFDGGTFGFGVQPVLTLSDVANGLEIAIGFDGEQPDGGDLGYEADVEVTLTLSEENADEEATEFAVVGYYAEENIDAKVSFTEPTAGGLADMIGATLAVELFDLTADDLIWNIDVTGDYDSNGLNPYFGFGTGSDEIVDLNVGVNLGADLTGMENTTFTLDYESDDLTEKSTTITKDLGLVTFKVLIEL